MVGGSSFTVAISRELSQGRQFSVQVRQAGSSKAEEKDSMPSDIRDQGTRDELPRSLLRQALAC